MSCRLLNVIIKIVMMKIKYPSVAHMQVSSMYDGYNMEVIRTDMIKLP